MRITCLRPAAAPLTVATATRGRLPHPRSGQASQSFPLRGILDADSGQLSLRTQAWQGGSWLTRGACSTPSRGMCSKGIFHGAKTAAANQLLRTFLSGGTGFDNQFANARITSVDDGSVDLEMDVTKQMLNPYSTLHGGAIASLVDMVGTLAIITQEPTKPGVSVEMNVSYLSTAKEGQTLLVRGTAHKIGKKLAFTSVDIMCKESGKLIATGRHTKVV